jgi:RNA polymerase primary sigma factor
MDEINDLVKLYLKDIEKYKILNRDEEYELLKESQNGNFDAKQTLIVCNLRLVVNVAKRYLNKGLNFIDLISEGNIGLIYAINKFDYTKGYRFSTYAVWWIKQSISKAIINKGREIRIPSYKHDMFNKINKFVASYIAKTNTYPEHSIISIKTGISEKNVREIMLEFQTLISLDSIDADNSVIDDFLNDDMEISLEQEILNKISKKDLINALSSLKDREKEVLILRFGLNDDDPQTLEEIGKVYNVTRERVRQIEKKALEKLKLEFDEKLKWYLED